MLESVRAISDLRVAFHNEMQIVEHVGKIISIAVQWLDFIRCIVRTGFTQHPENIILVVD